MKTIKATYRIVTPMFIGGADQTPSDGVRPPSFKGALRFWWRALNWSRYQDLAKLHEKEAELFGGASRKLGSEEAVGQGKFLLSIAEKGTRTTLNDWPTANSGAGYLAYGILASKGGKRGTPVPHRIGIKEGLRFTATLRFKPGVEQEDIDSVQEAINVLGLLGGLGSRSRRGYGSLSLEGEGKPESLGVYQERLNEVFSNDAEPAEFTAFHSNCSFNVLNPSDNARTSINKAGALYKDYRNSINDERNKRISFGLPLQGVDEKTRRASPLFFHVHALENNQFVTVVSYMPTKKFHHSENYQDIRFDSVQAFVGGLS